MTQTELLLTLNSLLLTVAGLLLGVIGFFLKDLHKKFSELVDKVNLLNLDHNRETSSAKVHRESQEKTITALTSRIERLELNTFN